jgi:hypothetical protein
MRTTVKTRWKSQWEDSTRSQRIGRIDQSLPSSKFRKIAQGLSRTETSILTQLRTNHSPLNAHLHRIKKIEHPFCRYCQGETIEDVNHFFFVCPAYAEARRNLERKLV